MSFPYNYVCAMHVCGVHVGCIALRQMERKKDKKDVRDFVYFLGDKESERKGERERERERGRGRGVGEGVEEREDERE